MTDAADGGRGGRLPHTPKRVDPLNAEGPFDYAIQWWL